MLHSMDWFKGKSTRNHKFSAQICGFPVEFPLNQSIDTLRFFFFQMVTSPWPLNDFFQSPAGGESREQ